MDVEIWALSDPGNYAFFYIFPIFRFTPNGVVAHITLILSLNNFVLLKVIPLHTALLYQFICDSLILCCCLSQMPCSIRLQSATATHSDDDKSLNHTHLADESRLIKPHILNFS
jgi:hypothetical protein